MRPLDGGNDIGAIRPLIIKVRKPISVGHGNLRQIMECEITEGPEFLQGRPIIALIFDPLYASILDLAIIPDDLEISSKVSPIASLTASLSGQTMINDDDSKKQIFIPPTRSWTSKLFQGMGPLKMSLPTEYRLQSRRSFMESLFQSESEIYSALKDLQGQFIPECIGYFVIKWKKRELPGDRLVNVILVERVDGQRLSRFPITSLTPEKKRGLAKQIKEIMMHINRRGALMPKIDSEDFIVEGVSKIRLVDFLAAEFVAHLEIQRAYQENAMHELLESSGLLS